MRCAISNTKTNNEYRGTDERVKRISLRRHCVAIELRNSNSKSKEEHCVKNLHSFRL